LTCGLVAKGVLRIKKRKIKEYGEVKNADFTYKCISFIGVF
jgi:hypothetical protein